ncbi:MAG: radical SAM protein, partial [Methanobacterium paludis]|nr:radical SAM protein [Methanobacterium paludis]
FMDPWNFDQDRVRRCVIHYAVPDGRIIPFCSMNTIYRNEIEKKFAVPFNEHETE